MHYFFTFILLVFTSCSFLHKDLDWNDYVKYINDADHGLVKKKYINHLEFTMQYLPPEYLVHRELNGDTSYTVTERDSILNLYNHNLTFVLSIQPDEREGESPIEDVLFYNIKDKDEYTFRMMHLNFDIKDEVTLSCDSSAVYSPVITNMENNYGLSKGRKITLVFTPLKSKEEFLKAKQITLNWNDEVFETGRQYFSFDASELFSIPGLKL
ncbi:MAG TPA: hypothetical protein VK750_02045 [Cytophagaceae bacterium]|jgi:hypothetical protein|nr:hypothetical protein [Cytophagaceae bacterium]